MIIEAAGFSHTGTRRAKNEDAVLMHDQIYNSGFFEFEGENHARIFVADGVGGAPAGDIAAHYVLSQLNQRIPPASYPQKTDLEQTLISINNDLCEYGKSNLHTHSMATTLSGILVNDHQYRIVNAGDSRVMILRGKNLEQLTTDDIMDVHAMYRPLTNYFGGPVPLVKPAIIDSDEDLKTDTLFFISSDGIFHCFSTNQLGKILANSSSLATKAKSIRDEALATGSPDNISCVLLKISF